MRYKYKGDKLVQKVGKNGKTIYTYKGDKLVSKQYQPKPVYDPPLPRYPSDTWKYVVMIPFVLLFILGFIVGSIPLIIMGGVICLIIAEA